MRVSRPYTDNGITIHTLYAYGLHIVWLLFLLLLTIVCVNTSERKKNIYARDFLRLSVGRRRYNVSSAPYYNIYILLSILFTVISHTPYHWRLVRLYCRNNTVWDIGDYGRMGRAQSCVKIRFVNVKVNTYTYIITTFFSSDGEHIHITKKHRD